jgi:nucleotide-binding universal stress UspA family protein
MQPIVVPVNYAPNSANAARYAADMALAIKTCINLIYVLQPPVTATEMPLPEAAFDKMQDNGFQLLKQLSEDLLRRTGGKISIVTDLEIGRVEDKVREFCDRKSPLMVVMGASGHALENLLEGSHTLRTLRHLPYPLLVIPENARFHPIQKIIVACDRDDIDSGMPASLPFLKDLGKLFDARFEVVHVITDDEDCAGEAILDYNEWKGRLKGFDPELRFVRTKEVNNGIGEYLHDHKGDWLMVFPKRHGMLEFHKSQAKQLAISAAVPVLSLHE